MTDREAIEAIEYARAFNEKHTPFVIALGNCRTMGKCESGKAKRE